MYYLADGREVIIKDQLKEGYLGRRIYYDEFSEGSYIEGDLEIFQNVYRKPPKEKINEEIVKLREELITLKLELKNIEEKLKEKDNDYRCFLEKNKKYEALKHLEEFIEGKITHYVINTEYDILGEIVSREEYKDTYDNIGQRLLTLYGDSKGDLQWKISNYSDGSGVSLRVYPFLSYEEAIVFLQNKCDKLEIEKISKNLYNLEKLLKIVKKYDLKISDNIKELYKNLKNEEINKNINEYETKIKSLKNSLIK